MTNGEVARVSSVSQKAPDRSIGQYVSLVHGDHHHRQFAYNFSNPGCGLARRVRG